MPDSMLPISQIAVQQPDTVAVTQPADAALELDADPEKLKLMQRQLVLVLHAHKCQRLENQSKGEVRQCYLSHCREMKHLLNHMATCQTEKLCAIPHCSSTRQIISHWTNCTQCDCPVCLPIKQASRRQHQAVADPEKQRRMQQQLCILLHALECRTREIQSNIEVGQCSFHHCLEMKHVLNHLATCKTGKLCAERYCSSSRQIILHWMNCIKCDCSFCWPIEEALKDHQGSESTPDILNNTAELKIQLRLLLQDSATDELINQSAESFLNAVPNQDVPVVPDDDPATVEDWHHSVTGDLRYRLIQKLVQTIIYPTTDKSIMSERRLIDLVMYAKRVEEDIYDAANSRVEYYQIFAERIYKTRKDLEIIRLKRKEFQLRQMQHVGPILDSMTGSSSGAQSPMFPAMDEISQSYLSSLNILGSQQRMASPDNDVQTNTEAPSDPELLLPSAFQLLSLNPDMTIPLNQSQMTPPDNDVLTNTEAPRNFKHLPSSSQIPSLNPNMSIPLNQSQMAPSDNDVLTNTEAPKGSERSPSGSQLSSLIPDTNLPLNQSQMSSADN